MKSTVPNKTQVRLAGYSLQVNRPELKGSILPTDLYWDFANQLTE